MGAPNQNQGLQNQNSESEKEISARSKVFSHLSATILAVLFVACVSQFDLDGLKGLLLDVNFHTHAWANPNPDLALIAYDDESSTRYEGSSKIPAEELAQVFELLAEEKPRAVGIFTTLNEKTYSETELALLAKAFQKVPHSFIGYTDDESLGKNPPALLGKSIGYLPGFVSRDTFSYGADSVTRRVMLTIDGTPTLHEKLAHFASSLPADTLVGATHSEKIGNSVQTYINWQGPPGTYRPYSSRDAVERTLPKGTFHDKIVLIGSSLEAKKGADHIFTPYSRKPLQTPMLEGVAHGLATLIKDDGLSKSPWWWNWAASLVVGILTVNMVLFLSPGKGILFVLLEVFAIFVISWIALFAFNIWLDSAHALIIACVGYYLVIPYRLVDEYRKRWHYQEKSELMMQLELLKSNFLSLVSHDLKTPIARIQGNAELALNEGDSLNERQKKFLAAIVHTTEDLSQYVETVLDLTRVESAQVPLQKTSKDINTTIKEVIESKHFMAVEKNITLSVQLEPIFSFKFDVKLIRRVLSNLVENAIKYSPNDSQITLVSKEDGNWIRVSVVDEGRGIPAEEQEKVFTKFYRCQNDLTDEVKGTGLGLYLVKYFVELHRGVVELKSELGRGSTFTVSLPV